MRAKIVCIQNIPLPDSRTRTAIPTTSVCVCADQMKYGRVYISSR